MSRGSGFLRAGVEGPLAISSSHGKKTGIVGGPSTARLVALAQDDILGERLTPQEGIPVALLPPALGTAPATSEVSCLLRLQGEFHRGQG